MKSVDDAGDLRRTSLRLGLQSGLLVVACLFVVGALVFVVYERAADNAANRLLSETTANIDSASEAPPGVRVVVVTPQGRSESPGMPEGLPDEEQLAATARDGQTRQVEISREGDRYTVRTEAVGQRVTEAILDRQETDEQRGRILTALLVAGAAGVLLAALVAAWLARRTVRPMADTIALQRRFVADASHELRTPLTLLSTRAQLLSRRLHRDPQVTEQVVADVEGVVADTRILTEILDDLLSAADTGGQAEWTDVDLGELITDVVTAARASAGEAGVALNAGDLASSVVVEGSPVALRRALTALVDNAVGHASSSVVVAVGVSGHRVEVEVSDDGPGIPEELAPRLFERFSTQRADTAGRDGRRHYGLGLALVADVAANHGGSVAVSGRTDGANGAVFVLTLPASGRSG